LKLRLSLDHSEAEFFCKFKCFVEAPATNRKKYVSHYICLEYITKGE